MPLIHSKKPKMIRIIPSGIAIIVTQKMSPTTIRIKPIPAVINLPSKAKMRPTSVQTSLKGNKIRLKSTLVEK